MSRITFSASTLVVATSLLSGPALADSSLLPTTSMGETSMVAIECKQCPPVKDPDKVGAYVVQELKPGTQKVEMKEINGKKMIVRTEAWMGGSPVVFMNAQPGEGDKDLDKAVSAQPMPSADKAAAEPANVAAEPVAAVAEPVVPAEAQADPNALPAASLSLPKHLPDAAHVEEKAETPAAVPQAEIDQNTTSAVAPQPDAFDPAGLEMRPAQ